jgi:hypothetical protein
MGFKFGRGLLGPMKPLIGHWVHTGEHNRQTVRVTRLYEPWGKGWVRLTASWTLPDRDYVETAFYGATTEGPLGFWSFTNDGRCSQGMLADGSDVHAQAVAFVAKFPAGTGRMIAWPRDDGLPGFEFAVESQTQKGWNRFLVQRFDPVP